MPGRGGGGGGGEGRPTGEHRSGEDGWTKPRVRDSSGWNIPRIILGFFEGLRAGARRTYVAARSIREREVDGRR